MRNEKLPLLLPIRCIIFPLVFVIAVVVTGRSVDELSSIWSVAATVVNIALVLFLVFVTRKNGGFRRMINYEKGKTRLRQVIGMTVLISVLSVAGMYLCGYLCYGIILYTPPMIVAPIPGFLAVLNLLLLPVSTALAEDSLYLGCGVGQITNKYASVIVPAFFFALQHCFIPTFWDLRYMIYRFFSFLPLTVFLCIHYRKNGNPLPIMVGHAVIDIATSSTILATSLVPGFYDMMCSR